MAWCKMAMLLLAIDTLLSHVHGGAAGIQLMGRQSAGFDLPLRLVTIAIVGLHLLLSLSSG